jgi:hypothetical protein
MQLTVTMRRCVALVVVLTMSMAFSQPKLLICMPGKQNTQRLQNGFDTLVGQGTAIVLGRIKDVEALLPVNPDAAIISSKAFFNYLPGYTYVLVGKKKQQAGEKYFIVTASKEISKESIARQKVGIIDFLNKDRLPKFVHDQFNLNITFLKRVNKEDDLLTMLGMEVVDAIIVSASQYRDIYPNTRLPLTIIATSENNVGFAVCAAKEGKIDDKLVQALLKTPVYILKELGIDSWEKP